ncbi:MAG: hypothetical protein V1913_05150 [Fibrobacterota bacterium]
MENKLQELTQTLYAEGVQKGEARAREIVAAAEAEAARKTAEAKQQAESLIAIAKKEASELKRKTDAELRLSSQQALLAVKKSVEEAVTAKAFSAPLARAFGDADTLKELLKALLSRWDIRAPGLPALSVLLPENKRAALAEALNAELAAVLASGVTLRFSEEQKNGFQVRSDKDGFRISFTDDDFLLFFKQHLRPLSRACLFGE